MSDSISAALPPKGNGGLIAVGIIMLLTAGGAVFWKSQQTEAETETVEKVLKVATKEVPPPMMDNAPPPPPPEEEEVEEKKKVVNSAGTKKPQGPKGCSGTCSGNATSALRSALGARGAMARSCYNTALRRNPNLAGKMTMSVRISPNGTVCSARVSSNSLGDAGVASCAAAKFRAAKFPAPDGGCVDTAVPLNFTKK